MSLVEISKKEFEENYIDLMEGTTLEDIQSTDSLSPRDYFDLDEWDNLKDDDCGYRYVKCKGKVYKWTFEEDGVCEVTHEHRIMYFENIYEEVTVLEEMTEKMKQKEISKINVRITAIEREKRMLDLEKSELEKELKKLN